MQLNATNPQLIIRNFSRNTNGNPIPIHVTTGMGLQSGTTIQVLLDGSAWGSTISFDPNIPVGLGGNLELGMAPGTSPASLVGDTFQLFDWSGVSPSGQFGQVLSGLPTRYVWDTSGLYTSGMVRLTIPTSSPINGQWATNGGGTWSGTANWTGGNVPGPLRTWPSSGRP